MSFSGAVIRQDMAYVLDSRPSWTYITDVARPGVIEIGDQIFNGAVTKLIAELRAEGASHERIAFHLVAEFNLPVSRVTVLRYFQNQLKETA